ncbi:MAG TPA: trehalase-like domain-containing protein [Polyangiaceae bacterium]|nr:trehalase-like domain-containing protein [Polyangiaceae bacterium]
MISWYRAWMLSDLGLIGNCQIAAHVRRDGAIVWCCLPRFDSPPVFGALLDEQDGGRFSIGPSALIPGVQRYLPNTNVLETRFDTPDGAFRVLDFAPRVWFHGYSIELRLTTDMPLSYIDDEPFALTTRPQTFSSLMCWAAADCMSRIAAAHRPDEVQEFALAAARIRDEILINAVDPERGCLLAD